MVSLSITALNNKTFVINPGNANGESTNGGTTNYTTINNYYGKDGSASTIITLPAGKDGTTPTITYTKNPDGTYIDCIACMVQRMLKQETLVLTNGVGHTRSTKMAIDDYF